MTGLLEQFPLLLYPALFLFLLAEGTGIPGFPYEAAFLASGYWVEQGRLSFWLLVLIGTVACLAGNLIGYWVGKSPALKLAGRMGLSLKENKESVERARRLLERYGIPIILVSRWFGPLRTPVTIGAGVMGMNLPVYLWSSLAGDFIWTLAWQWAGWQASGWLVRRWSLVGWKGELLVVVLGVLCTVLFLLFPAWLLRRRARRQSPPGD